MNHHSLFPGSSPPAMGESPKVTDVEPDTSSDSENKSAGERSALSGDSLFPLKRSTQPRKLEDQDKSSVHGRPDGPAVGLPQLGSQPHESEDPDNVPRDSDNSGRDGAEEQNLLPGVLKLPGAEIHAADPAWEHLNEGTKVPVSLPLIKSGGNNSDSDERNADAATISHHSQSSHRDPVAGEISGETTSQEIANLRGEISQLRGQLESLQVTVETLSKNMQRTWSSEEASKAVREAMTPSVPPEGKRVLIKDTTPPKINSASEDDTVPPPEPVVQKGKQPRRGVAKRTPTKRTEVVTEVPTKTHSDLDDDAVPPPEPVVKIGKQPRRGVSKSIPTKGTEVVKEAPTKTDSDSDNDVVPPSEPVVKKGKEPRRGVAKRIPTKRTKVAKEVPTKTDSDSDDDVVPPPEPAVKPRTKPRSRATKVVLPKTQRRNVVKKVPTEQSTTYSNSKPPEQTVKSGRVVAKGIPGEKAWEKLECVAPRRSARLRKTLEND
ncbi:hypothetical protein B0H14DRAFT_2687092 [Mycena olivaceomarginata]|nr:hypothetical protein B0H14DRAFT_2687092 [Mycena olivaceomarginata]